MIKLKKALTVRTSILLFNLLLVIPLLMAAVIIDYYSSLNDLTESYNLLKNQTEQNVINLILTLETTYDFFDRTFDDRQKIQLAEFLGEYEKSGRKPENINLEKLKEKFGGKTELYIIDSNGIIRWTTYKTDMGLDFKKFPDFYNNLMTILTGDSFSGDRIAGEVKTGLARKYAYHPTPDHKYILEVGLLTDEIEALIKSRDPVRITENLIRLNPLLISVKFIDSNGTILGTDIKNDPKYKTIYDKISKLKEPLIEYDTKNNFEKKYFFIEIRSDEFASIHSRVFELIYDNTVITKRMNLKIFYYVLFFIAAIFISIVFAFFISSYLSRPIGEFVKNVDIIAAGNLEHSIKVSGYDELFSLEKSVNTMVGNIKDNIARLTESETRIKEYNEHLEQMVEERTKKLVESEKMAALGNLVASVAHEINTPVGNSITGATHLKKITTEFIKNYDSGKITKLDFKNFTDMSLNTSELIFRSLEKAGNLIISFKRLAVDQAVEVKREFNICEYLGEILMNLQPNLKNKIIEIDFNCNENLVINSYPGVFFQLLLNLINNSVIHGFEDSDSGKILIDISKKNGDVTFIYSDNGKGVSKENLEHLYDPFFTTKRNSGCTGLGMNIIYNIVTRKLHGIIGVDSGLEKGFKLTIVFPV